MEKWFYSRDNQTHGPFAAEEIKTWAAKGLVHRDDLIWREGSKRASAVPAHAAFDFDHLLDPGISAPDWLEDVAKLEAKGPVPSPPPCPDEPDWLHDLQLWYGFGKLPEPNPLPPTIPSTSPPAAKAVAQRLPMASSPAPTSPTLAAKGAIPAAKSPAATMPAPVDSLAQRAIQESGFDPRTGQILNPAQFQKWKQQKANPSAPADAPTNASIMEVFRNGRTAIETWIDDDNNKTFVIQGDATAIHNNPQLSTMMREYAKYGTMMLEKLQAHFAFVLENRRKYHAAVSARIRP